MASDLTPHFLAFAGTTRRRAPLYSRLSAGLAGLPLLDELYTDAPAQARMPVMLFGAVHYLLLADPQVPLARFYPNLGGTDDGDPLPAFLDFCAAHAGDLRHLIATRLPQTNEVGRSALLLAGLGQLEPGPVGLLDVGASAGLNLLLDRFAYADGAGNRLGESTVLIDCEVRGRRPGGTGGHGLADRMPALGARLGLDTTPVDLADADATRWVEACVWPDQADRFERLRRAVALHAAHPVEVRRGDAVDGLEAALRALATDHPVVATSWVLSYLPAASQADFVAVLDGWGATHRISWVWVEAPNLVSALPVEAALANDPGTLLGLSTWRDGVRTDRLLARCHPHGYWLRWL